MTEFVEDAGGLLFVALTLALGVRAAYEQIRDIRRGLTFGEARRSIGTTAYRRSKPSRYWWLMARKAGFLFFLLIAALWFGTILSFSMATSPAR